MIDCISREAVKSKKVYSVERHELVVPVAEIDWIPPADVVARDAFNRILAENDTMRNQLAEIGKKPGDQMYDVRSVQWAKWIVGKRETRCSGCGWIFHKNMKNFPYCPICASSMIREGEG